MNGQYKEIEDLLTRFFDGKTSNSEEQELYAFFKREDIPVHLEAYKDIFQYFEDGIKVETVADKYDFVNHTEIKKHSTKKWTIVMAVAASILALLLIKPVFMDSRFDPYQGSYIIRNGEKSYDKEEIKAKEKEIEKLIAQKEAEIEQLYHLSDEKMEELSEIENQFENEW